MIDAIQFIRANTPNISTEELNKHPIVKMYVFKLTALSTGECFCDSCFEDYRTTHNKVEQIIETLE